MGPEKPALSIAVGSTNPVKIKAARAGVVKAFPETKFEVTIQGFSVPSEVSDQPMGDAETKMGAKNRAKNAADKYKEQFGSYPSFSVGMEGGCVIVPSDEVNAKEELLTIAYMCVFDAEKNKIGFGRTGSYTLPDKIAELVKGGMELGFADDQVFGKTNSKQDMGSVGLLTSGLINRFEYYDHAMVLALIPFMNPELY